MPRMYLRDAAAYLNVNYGTLRNWVSRGKLSPVGLGEPGQYGCAQYLYDTDAILAVRPRRHVIPPAAPCGPRPARGGQLNITLSDVQMQTLRRLQVAYGKSASEIIRHLIETAGKVI